MKWDSEFPQWEPCAKAVLIIKGEISDSGLSNWV